MAQPADTSLEQRIWIFEKGGQYRVHPSPKAVKKEGHLTFVNLTSKAAVVNAKGTLSPDKLEIPDKKGLREGSATATGALGHHEYEVLVDGTKAHGAWSDPDIIIDP